MRRRRRARAEPERVLPLVNIVFLLLIFFMVAGRLAEADPFPIAPPHSARAGPDAEAPATIHLGADGRLVHAGAEGGVEAVAARAAEAGGAVRVKADAGAPAAALTALLAALEAAGVGEVRLLAAGRAP